MKIEIEINGWRFTWRPFTDASVRISTIPSSAHEYQMDPPTIHLPGSHPTGRPFGSVLNDFERRSREWVANVEAGV